MTADTVGGVWTYALELVKALHPYGIQVHLATMGSMPAAVQQKEAASIPNLQLHAGNFQLEWMDNPWQEVDAAGEWLLQLEREVQPDLVHLNNYCHGQLPWQTPVLMVGHSCVRSWWKAVKGEEAPVNYTTYTQRVKEGLQAANLVAAPTKAYLDELRYYYGPFSQEAVIANSRDRALFKPGMKEAFILSAGRLWDDAKNLSACEPAAAKLPWPIEIAGEHQHPGNGNAKAYSHLKFLGRLSPDALAAKMAAAAIYVMPARYEPFGLSILEAALSGCALVLGDIPSLRENWEGVALFVDPQDPEDICSKLDFLIRHPRIRKRMGILALDRAADFSPGSQAAAYVHYYRQLLEAHYKEAEVGLSLNR
ncbi:glycosyltransferase family 4 protein [Cesiribacter sp. SM1]|uniref:glycosyltransferase family 4 protein n=1 Tax=Cesiribacter sp. SM1 TaxID=2861196 RepID=UPI001CD7A51C|nr:glycosyltransferase family 4 protein [Cesiribacter sp. SM1]